MAKYSSTFVVYTSAHEVIVTDDKREALTLEEYFGIDESGRQLEDTGRDVTEYDRVVLSVTEPAVLLRMGSIELKNSFNMGYSKQPF